MEFSENQNQLNKKGNIFVQVVLKTNKTSFPLLIYPITLSFESSVKNIEEQADLNCL